MRRRKMIDWFGGWKIWVTRAGVALHTNWRVQSLYLANVKSPWAKKGGRP